MDKDLSTPHLDAARERQCQIWEQIEALPPLRWYQLAYWRFWWWKRRHGL